MDAKAELDINLPEAELVFVKPNGQFRGTETVRHAFKVINYELGIKCRFHDFRDTHATRLIEQGADIKAVSKRLGHSQFKPRTIFMLELLLRWKLILSIDLRITLIH